MLTRLWRKALQVLDRPGRRGLLIGPGSIWTSLTYRTPGTRVAASKCRPADSTPLRRIGCHDFLAGDEGSDDLRTKAFVRQFLVEHGFQVTTREDAPEPWTRDYVYAVNIRAA